MGYLLKEFLKNLCGVNQWSYAVFWKMADQNPKLLICEECYYEPTMPFYALTCTPGTESSELAFEEWEAPRVSTKPQSAWIQDQSEDKIGLLMDKMMMNNRLKVVGEGLVGRAAFTGNHLWILSENYARETQPPEVQNEVCHQFSSGIKTVAVIPVLSHGVVQLGSSSTIRENMAFVNNVKSLILELGCVPGDLLSVNFTSEELSPVVGIPVCLGKSALPDLSGSYKVEVPVPFEANTCNQQHISSQPVELLGQPSHSLIKQADGYLEGTSTFQAPKPAHNVVGSQIGLCQPNVNVRMKPSLLFSSHPAHGSTRGEIISSRPEILLNQQVYLQNLRPGLDEQPCVGSSFANSGYLRLMDEQFLSGALGENITNNLSTSSDCVTSQLRTNEEGLSSSCHPRSILNPCCLPMEVFSFDLMCHSTDNKFLSRSSNLIYHPGDDKCHQIEVAQKGGIENDLFQAHNIQLVDLGKNMNFSEDPSAFDHDSGKNKHGNTSPRSRNAEYQYECIQPSSRDDLFDIVGVDFKNKQFNDEWSAFCNSDMKTLGNNNCTPSNLQSADSDLYLVDGANSESGIFSATGTDHLLDAVVNRVHIAAKQSSDDSMSGRTTLTKISGSPIPSASTSNGLVSGSDERQGELFGLHTSLEKLGTAGSCSFKSESKKEDAGNGLNTSSIYGSQISSWVEQGHSSKQNNSASTAYSKRPDEVNKPSRKRLKPGENPRPRPKDRQMIQDRMKELREIVPNGAKCSQDLLLERTIKHMLFLQSVTKHSDKLKQTGESKILDKDGGLLLKDNSNRGRTWAYEVGSQSVVCPLIVEDLNSPRQMLVEMLCEERGLFLEIADVIRGLGLTILKGVMETRNDKIWAHFAVEANRDVTRMEIFLSLIHLLEQNGQSSAAPGNGIENGDMAVHQNHAALIPATGGCSSQ
ncbi:transcription factor LHW-like [Diospyros lotus]|uniref:transcription factor LHW-like n=1 Tax=Diospyros lotus TaxID=55363 RepID=UPI00225B20D4|nr:transcription factor LHW-like [Diospyros lotus]